MLKNYLVVACRSLLRNRVFSAVNILGLSVGLTAFIIIALYVRFELSYDDFHKHSGDIYRVATKVTLQNEVINHESSTYYGIVDYLKEQCPEVKALTVISTFTQDNAFLRYEDSTVGKIALQKFQGCYADSSFFSVFSFPLERGNPKTVLREAYSAVISESLASKYFDSDPIGKVLEFKDDRDAARRLKITGVLKDVPENSHLKFDIAINVPEAAESPGDPKHKFWEWVGHPYMMLQENAEPKKIERDLNRLAVVNNGLKINKDDYDQVSTFHLQRLRDIHLSSHLDYEFETPGSSTLIYALVFLGTIILGVAWINYINLATAISAQRISSIGIRKVIGASRAGLMLQVLTESALFNFFSVAMAVLLAVMLLPAFGNFVGVSFVDMHILDMNFWIALFGFFVVSSIVSGWYPARMIASLYPLSALKGKKGGLGGVIFRKGLVVSQFTAAIVLMIVTVVGFRQLSFMQKADLGIDIDRVLVVNAFNFDQEFWSDEAGGYVVDSLYQHKARLFTNELRKYAGINNVSAISHLPGETPVWGTEFKAEGMDPDRAVSLKAVGIDYDFIPTFHVSLLGGRNFSRDFPSDQGNEWKRAVLINEAACSLLGFRTPADAISRHISTFWGADYEIVGVVNSFHQLSLKQNLTPLYFVLQPRALSYFAVDLNQGDVTGKIEMVKKTWNRYFQDFPFNYFFLDDYFNRQYRNEQRFDKIAGVFTLLTVFIGCMGLFGLTAYALAQRTKEIGIRKVFGATVLNVMALFTSDFIRLTLISSTIAIPLSYFALNRWLDTYAYKTNLAWWLFVFPVLVVLAIAAVTIGFQALRASRINPIESLKHE